MRRSSSSSAPLPATEAVGAVPWTEDHASTSSAPPQSEQWTIPGYVLTQLLGRGAYGQVWQAVKIGSGQDVAIKLFTRTGPLDWRYLQREVDRLLRVAEHPHIVTPLDANLQNEPPFYAMMLLRNGSLAQRIQPNQPWRDIPQAVTWFEQITRALEFAHGKGLLHCDLKPANILLDEEGQVRVVDFGQALLRGEAVHALGTIAFMSPEQAEWGPMQENRPDPSVSWDVYGLGATLYTLLSGRPPHPLDELQLTLTSSTDLALRLARYRQYIQFTPPVPLRQLNAQVDGDLADIVHTCLQPDPVRRYQNITAVLDDLRRRREYRPLRCQPASWGKRLRKFIKRNLGSLVISLVAILAICVATGTLYYAYQSQIDELNSQRTTLEAQKKALESRLEQAEAELQQWRSLVPPIGDQD
ncbi:MAG: Serine/threonine-protein kinase PknD [Phycisphaerae bacterium]|nr:Serine/threonine-protein kinase PknD [Phycisphaerae bacterium]